MKKLILILSLVVINLCTFGGTYYAADKRAYQRGVGDGAKMVVEGCYENRENNTAVLNGDTGHALLCQGVDTGLIRPGAGIDVLRAPSTTPNAGEPETDEEIQKKLKDPHQT